MKKILVTTILIIGIAHISSAQKEIVSQNHSWYDLGINARFNDQWSAILLYSWRREGIGKDWQQSLLRIGATRTLKSGPQLTFGYDWVITYPYGEQAIAYSFIEHRPFEQLVLKQKANRLGFTHRYRLEQRFLERKTLDAEGVYITDEYLFRQRVRYRLSLSFPLNGPDVKKGSLLLTAFNEVFLLFGKGVAKNVLDQNWLSGGLNYHLTDDVKLSAGYMNQYLIKGDGIHAERNHTLLVGVKYALDLNSPD